MSSCLQESQAESRDLVKTEEDISDLDIIELGSDHAQSTKTQSDIPAEKQCGISKDFLENDNELLVIDLQDVEKLCKADSRTSLQSFDDMRNLNKDKKFDEWVYVETNRKTFQIHDNLLLVSTVYEDDPNCCVLQ